jgi:cell wall-associated NlpC family hydrolase
MTSTAKKMDSMRHGFSPEPPARKVTGALAAEGQGSRRQPGASVAVPARAVRAAGAASSSHRQRSRGLAAVRAADHSRARQQLLQIRSLTRRTLRRSLRGDKRFELALAVAASVFEYGHVFIVLARADIESPFPSEAASLQWANYRYVTRSVNGEKSGHGIAAREGDSRRQFR